MSSRLTGRATATLTRLTGRLLLLGAAVKLCRYLQIGMPVGLARIRRAMNVTNVTIVTELIFQWVRRDVQAVTIVTANVNIVTERHARMAVFCGL